MTLVVFKNGILATDSRRTHECAHNIGNKCAHCNKRATSVNDDANKLNLVQGRHEFKIRGEKILVYASSGSVSMIGRIRTIVRRGLDIEEVFRNFVLVHGTHTKIEDTCTTLFVGETHNFVMRMRPQGQPSFDVYEKDKFIAIGSGTQGARWINKLMPTTWAPLIINMVMEDDIGVGGTINYVDFTEKQEEGKQRLISMYMPNDPKDMIERANKIFELGEEQYGDNPQAVKEEVKYPEIWDLPISDLGLKVHTLNHLMVENSITRVAELIYLTPQQVLNIPKIGKVALQEIHGRLKDRKLTLGTDTTSWPHHKKA